MVLSVLNMSLSFCSALEERNGNLLSVNYYDEVFESMGKKNDSELSLSYAQKALSETKKPDLPLNKTHIHFYILS